MTAPSCGRVQRQRGISIVEIMVGMAVGLVLIAGVASLVLGSR